MRLTESMKVMSNGLKIADLYFFAFTGLFKCLFIKLLWLEANKRRKGVSPIVEDVLTTYRHKSKEKYNFHESLLDKSVITINTIRTKLFTQITFRVTTSIKIYRPTS